MKRKKAFLISAFLVLLFISGAFLAIKNPEILNKNYLLASILKSNNFSSKENEEIITLKEKVSLLEKELEEKDKKLEQLDVLRDQVDILDKKVSELENNFNDFKNQSLNISLKQEIEELRKISDELEKFQSLDNLNLLKSKEITETEETENILENQEISDENDKETETETESKNQECSSNSIDINTASLEELDKIVGIGLILAQRIIDNRPYNSLDELKKVSGIGDEKLKDIINQGCAYVENSTTSTKTNSSVNSGSSGNSSSSSKNQECSSNSIDINTASLEELDKIYGVGPSTAQKIIDNRPYNSLDDLIKVSGIGETTLQKIKDQGCAYVKNSKNSSNSSSSEISPSPTPETLPEPSVSPSPVLSPEIEISYKQNVSLDEKIPVKLSAKNLKKDNYGVKISIEKENPVKTISEICENYKTDEEFFECYDDKWINSFYYLNDVLINSNSEAYFLLRLNKEKILEDENFKGEANIYAKIRDSNEKIISSSEGLIYIDLSNATSTPPL
ncbi:MAG: helix-hairpin-helix domain-containing protein [Candidatus Pacebacteria bacterium]|nr:helix-hairpin-helix domain-containing protein [Candidatus Paceibacterota bacterium]